jgi:hypothetical protein
MKNKNKTNINKKECPKHLYELISLGTGRQVYRCKLCNAVLTPKLTVGKE